MKQDRRESLLDAAAALWEASGDDFTMDELAKKSGVPRASVYRLFESKSKLLQALSGERGLKGADDEQPEISQRIIRAGFLVLSQEGLAAATIERIAEVAGVGPATIYRRFQDKSTLLRAVAEASPPKQILKEAELHTDGDVEEQLYALCVRMIEVMSESGGGMLLALRDVKAHPELFGSLRSRQDRSHRLLAGWFSALMDAGKLRRADPVECAISLIGLLFSFSWMAPQLGMLEAAAPERHARSICALFLRGLLPSAAQAEQG